MHPPKVSVVTITYNQAPFVEQAIRSVFAQTTPFVVEHIVADDGSTDGTAEVLQKLAAEYPERLRLVLRDRNVGMMSNFCDAYHQASGEYVVFVEGDDYWTDPSKLQKQVDVMDSRAECSLCFHPAIYVDSQGNPLGIVHPPAFKEYWPIEEVVRGNPVQTCSMMVRRSCVPVLPEFFLRLKLGDWPLCILAACEGRLVCLPDAMSAYRVHAHGAWSAMEIAKRYAASSAMYFWLGIQYPQLRDLMEQALMDQAQKLGVESMEAHYLRSTRTWRIGSAVAKPFLALRSLFSSVPQ